MRREIRLLAVIVACLTVLCMCTQAQARTARVLPTKPLHSTIAPGYDRSHIEVKFKDDLEITLASTGVPISLDGAALKTAAARDILSQTVSAGGTWKPITGTWSNKIDELVANAERNLDRDIADLNNYYILTVPDDIITEEWLDQLNALDDVEIALAMPKYCPPPTPPDFQPQQGYLFSAPEGIEAATAWGFPGGTGTPTVGDPVKLCDFDIDFRRTHQDFPAVTELIPPGSVPLIDSNFEYHGTAILGILMSMDNGWGTTGIAPGVSGHFASYYLDGTANLALAMTHALTVFGPGDVFLLEFQVPGPNWVSGQLGMLPAEWWYSNYQVILLAIGNGVHVVECAANGNENLDDPAFQIGHAPFAPENNSGAIIVGAGATGTRDVDRSRIDCVGGWGSNWGSRLDLQGWGEYLVTTGSGNLYLAEGNDYAFGDAGPCGGGTSAAGAVVAGAVAIYESMYESWSGGVPLSPERMRNILKATGSPQQDGSRPASEHIGPRPNLVAAMDSLPTSCFILATGDSNSDAAITSADIIYAVNYVFKSGPAPVPCAAVGDVNCDGSVTSADIIYLVGYVFKGGPAPCDACTLVPDTWTCP